jgi:3-oxoacyl-[acyl-carrier protein] reductase
MNKKRIALVTGGTNGIGKEIAFQLSRNNYQVIVCGKSNTNLIDSEKFFRDKNLPVIVKKCDISIEKEVQKLLFEIYNTFNGLDVLVNNAGINETVDIEDLTLDKWNEILSVNLTGTFLVTKGALKYIKKSSMGRIINISSVAGRMGGENSGIAYSTSKGGIISMTYTLAKKLAKYNITVNCVAPGIIKTDMTRNYKKKIFNKLYIKRFGYVTEVANAVLYFASENSSYTTGAVLDVNGGMFIG